MFKNNINSDLMRGYKIEIYPTEDQKKRLTRIMQLYRYVYNWSIETEDTSYSKGNHFIGLIDMFKLFSNLRNSTPWLHDIPYNTAKEAIKNAYTAYMEFFKGRANRPKYKSKKRRRQSFTMRNDQNAFYFEGSKVKISGFRLGDLIECKNHSRIPSGDNRKYYKITVSHDGYRFWLSVNTERAETYEFIETEYNDTTIGIDVGFRKFATLSTGKVYKAPDTKRLAKRSQRQQSRIAKMRQRRYEESIRTRTKFEDIPMSKNEKKLRLQYLKTLDRIHNIHNTFIHQVSTEISNMYPSKVVMENLKVESLKQNRFMAKKIASYPSLYEFRFMIEYKCRDRGIQFELADVCFPSTQICSNCGKRHKVYTEEEYVCPYCGFKIDRDLNAAINLSKYRRG